MPLDVVVAVVAVAKYLDQIVEARPDGQEMTKPRLE